MNQSDKPSYQHIDSQGNKWIISYKLLQHLALNDSSGEIIAAGSKKKLLALIEEKV